MTPPTDAVEEKLEHDRLRCGSEDELDYSLSCSIENLEQTDLSANK